jgi:hypothetical protein
MPESAIVHLRAEIEVLARRSPYGWGHSMDFGPFAVEGLLLDNYLHTGGLSLLMAHRAARHIYAVDELPEHLEQCALTARAFGVPAIECVQISAYRLRERIPPAWHRGRSACRSGGRERPRAGETLGSAADRDLRRRLLRALLRQFGRFSGGMWWQPTALCIQDLCRFSGLGTPEIRFYHPQRCLARAVKTEDAEPLFTRGMNFPIQDIHDRAPRTKDVPRPRPSAVTGRA